MPCNRNPRLVVTKEAEMLTAPRYGLFSAGTVIEDMDPRAHNGIEYESVCDPGVEPHPMLNCSENPPGYAPEKIAYRSRSITEADPFALYAAERCFPLGESGERARDALRARITRGERHLVELAVDSGLIGASPYLRHPDATIPVSEPVGLADAIGVLEQQLAESGQAGIIHAPRWTGARFSGLGVTQRDGARMRTTLGTTLAFGSGYTGLPPAHLDDDGLLWLYATGPVTIRRSAIIEPATLQTGAFDPQRNSMFLLAERVYVVDWPCHTWAVPVDLDRVVTATLPLAPAPTITAHPWTGPAPLTVELAVDNHGHGPVNVYWGDDTDPDTVDDADTVLHTYTTPGDHLITVTGADVPSRDAVHGILVTPPISAPEQLEVTSATPTSLSLGWEWNQGGGPAVTHFEFRWAPLGQDWSESLQLSPTAREHTIDGLTPGHPYEFAVRALGETEVSSEASTTDSTADHPDPQITATPGAGFAPLAVDAVVDNHGHGPATVTWEPGVTSTVDDGATAGHTYTDPGQYTITATSDLWPQASGTTEVTATGPVAPPTGLTVDPEENTATLTWVWEQQDGPDADRFQARHTPDGEWTDLPAGTREHTFTDLLPGTEYEAHVRATHGEHASTTATVPFTTTPEPEPEPDPEEPEPEPEPDEE